MKNPVLVVGFNRPALTRRLLESVLAVYAPERLYFAVDGPRPGVAGEREKVDAVRALASEFAGRTELRTLFQEQNVGCAWGVPTGISWLFEHEDQGIILEDDIEVTPGLFRYMDWCLEHFRDDERVLHISSYQPVPPSLLDGQAEITLSTLPHCWGWATWRRAWRLYDPDIIHAPRRDLVGWIRNMVTDPRNVLLFRLSAEMTAQGKMKAWDYRWMITIARARGRCVGPRRSLVRNVGFGADCTHTVTSPHAEDLVLGDIDWSARPLVGEIDPEVGEKLHLLAHRAHSLVKLARMWVSTFVPNSVFFWVFKRLR